MTQPTDKAFIDCQWLSDHLGDADIKLLDGSWYLPGQQRNAKSEFLARRIPGARFFDIDAIADASTGLPHMLPSPEGFSAAAESMGINNDDWIIVYDGIGLFSAPRVWWMFRVFGHHRVKILHGGLPAWQDSGRALQSGCDYSELPPLSSTSRPFQARLRSELVMDFDSLAAAIDEGSVDVLDARGPGRFAGLEPEPRPGLRAGHMPNALNLPFTRLLNEQGTSLLDNGSLREVFSSHGVSPERPIVASCGSGITACILALGLFVTEGVEVAVYDGSWAEWGAHPGATVVVNAG